uniref:Uncharacterized protein n=1 Tax=Aplanochytrium stocchinoi TaxID=215587 RepID=A0A7S3PSU1_9STRA
MAEESLNDYGIVKMQSIWRAYAVRKRIVVSVREVFNSLVQDVEGIDQTRQGPNPVTWEKTKELCPPSFFVVKATNIENTDIANTMCSGNNNNEADQMKVEVIKSKLAQIKEKKLTIQSQLKLIEESMTSLAQ